MTGSYCAICHRPTSISDSHDHGRDDQGRNLVVCTACKADAAARWFTHLDPRTGTTCGYVAASHVDRCSKCGWRRPTPRWTDGPAVRKWMEGKS